MKPTLQSITSAFFGHSDDIHVWCIYNVYVCVHVCLFACARVCFWHCVFVCAYLCHGMCVCVLPLWFFCMHYINLERAGFRSAVWPLAAREEIFTGSKRRDLFSARTANVLSLKWSTSIVTFAVQYVRVWERERYSLQLRTTSFSSLFLCS